VPVLVLDAFSHSRFLFLEKGDLPVEDKTFLVAFPGYDVTQLPAARAKAIVDCEKKKKHYVDAFLPAQQQKV